ncbi:MAG: membrane protein insertase YidC [Candidatus Binataceae bacterium]
MDSTRSLIIFILLIVAAIFYADFVRWIRPPKAPIQQQAAAPSPAVPTATSAAGMQATAGMASPISTPMSSASAAAQAPGAREPESMTSAAISSGPPRTVEVNTDLYEATFTTKGARLLSFRLKRFHETVRKDSPLYDVVVKGQRLPMGLIVTRGDNIFGDREVSYTTDAPARVEVSPSVNAVVTFTGDTKEGLKLSKRFTFRDGSYLYDVDAEVGGATSEIKAIGLTMNQPLTERAPEQGYRDYPALQADVTGKVLNEYEKELKKGLPPVVGDISFAGIGDRYFLSAFIPKAPVKGELRMEYSGDEARAEMLFPGALKVSSAIYMGPKQLNLLEDAGPTLSKAINFGWFGVLAIIFVRALQILHTVAPNYGWDIILLTLAVRLATLPASIKAQRSALRMQRLAPQVEKIRAKFKDDSTQLNREMMELYKRNHVNPLGGCIPTAIQFPILYGLYEALLNSVELRHAPFIGWIRDLSAPDCLSIAWMPKVPGIDCHGLPILVLLMGISTFLQQWMMPKAGDSNQQKMMMWMPIFFTVLFIALPAGLSLYYFASNLLGIIQQFVLNREFKQYTPVATA